MAYTVVGGHNAIVPGASGCGYEEHTVARQMVAKVLEYMNAVGEDAYDCTDNVGQTKKACWTNAARNCNNTIGGNGLAISIHLNAASGNATGTEVLHYSSEGLASKVSSAVANALGIRDRGAKDGRDIGFINSTKAEAILIELCFIDNVSDMQKLMNNFDAVARAIVQATTGKTVNATEIGSQSGVFYIVTGGLGGNMIDTAHNFMNSKGWWYQDIPQGGGVVQLRTGGLDAGMLHDAEVFLQGLGWYYNIYHEDGTLYWTHRP